MTDGYKVIARPYIVCHNYIYSVYVLFSCSHTQPKYCLTWPKDVAECGF